MDWAHEKGKGDHAFYHGDLRAELRTNSLRRRGFLSVLSRRAAPVVRRIGIFAPNKIYIAKSRFSSEICTPRLSIMHTGDAPV